MNTSKILFYINIGFVIFLGIGWIYFYSFIILHDVSRMPRALTMNAVITGLNVLFLISLVLLPFTYRRGKHEDEIRK
jgi:hypothetical protein